MSKRDSEPSASAPPGESPVRYTALLEGSLVLNKHGEWVHEGIPFTNTKVSELFHRSVSWDEERRCFVVRIGLQQATFSCEDSPYFVAQVRTESSPWSIVLAGGGEEPLFPGSISIGKEDQFYCTVRGQYRARFMRAAHQTLLEHAVDENTLQIDGTLVQPSREPGA